MSAGTIRRGERLAPAGLAVGPIAWALSTQVGLALPAQQCAGAGWPWGLVAALAGAALTAGAGLVSWRASGRAPSRAMSFWARVSALAAALFVFALILQGLSSWMLTGCER
ncbi:MAG: hypothetical protein JO048_05720 [Methylobacteriaceae bacterium]|nr:hypothetical protein [Methylobacteriaceae bacterium]